MEKLLVASAIQKIDRDRLHLYDFDADGLYGEPLYMDMLIRFMKASDIWDVLFNDLGEGFQEKIRKRLAEMHEDGQEAGSEGQEAGS